MYADHRSICKFESPDDPGYVTLTEAFNTINKEIFNRSKSQFQPHWLLEVRSSSLTYLFTP